MKKAIAGICILLGIGSFNLIHAADNDEHAAQSQSNQSLTAEQPQATDDSQQEKVNINTADVETIANAINGIGVKRARAIVAYRQANGAFASVEDIAKVKGISSKFVKNRQTELNEKFTV